MQREELSFTDAAGRALETLASAEFSADLYAENLLGVPFLARVGSDDVSVPRMSSYNLSLPHSGSFSCYL